MGRMIFGDAAHHDHVVGRPAYEAVTTTIRRLVGRNVRTTVQTTVLASNLDGWEAVLQLSLRLGARGLTDGRLVVEGRSESFDVELARL
jgi:MoaA/NifB/PqqE/SkfB family radical SAM enzyme